ncbi:MAG: hypothetical protein DSZ11_06080 [Sulfurovum sp.]|nr:MAG: hypothetical protein DSZ11_06080 [Sulfurovum sp.]
MLKKIIYIVPFLLLIIGCSQQPKLPKDKVAISGVLTFDRVPATFGYGLANLDYTRTLKSPAKGVMVKAINKSGKVIATTQSDDEGRYSLFVDKNENIKIRVYARLYKKGFWDVSVVDNTNQKAMYVMEGAFHNSGEKHNIRSLHASSGWDGNGYSKDRIAAPFAILDSVYGAMDKVRGADSDAVFPQLTVNWSINNIAAGGDLDSGQIITSHYDGERGLWILGDANSDTDEYDDHIIVHEWGHYFEDVFSRSDSIGGPHSPGEVLDIRLAFGEGWGNALSGIVTDNPYYFDTSGSRQANGWYMDLEAGAQKNPGWYSEGSIQRILYDLYDTTNEAHDHTSLGFKPIYNVMIGKERNTKAFTSIFSFIDGLKKENSGEASNIDATVGYENISTIYDSYGTSRTNFAGSRHAIPLYRDLAVGGSIDICNQNNYGVYNKLGNRTYVRVKINQSGSYSFNAKPNGRVSASQDPDILIYSTKYPHDNMGISSQEGSAYDNLSMSLDKGEYLLDVFDVSFDNSCYTVSLDRGSASYSKIGKGEKIQMKNSGKKRNLPTRHYY